MNLKIKFNSNEEYNYIRDNIPSSMLVNDDIKDVGIFYIYYVPISDKWVSISINYDKFDALDSSLKDYVENIVYMEFFEFYNYSRDKKINDILYG